MTEKTFVVEVTMQDLQIVFALLENAPWKVANPIMQKVNAQVQAQLPPPAQVAAPAAAPLAPERQALTEPLHAETVPTATTVRRRRSNGVTDEAAGGALAAESAEEAAALLAENSRNA